MRRAISLFCIISAVIMFFAGCSKSKGLDTSFSSLPKKNILFVSKMNYGYHWGTVKQGASTAAREFNVDIDFAAPNVEEDVDEQIKLVNNALDNKDKTIDALVLAASDYDKLVGVTVKAYEKGIPVIIIDSEVNTSKISSYIATDNFEAGAKAGNVLISICGNNAHVAIMNFVKSSRNAEQREKGLLSVISKYPDMKLVGKEYCYSDTTLAYNLTKKIIINNPDVNAIVALNDISSEGVALAVDEMKLGGKVKVIAFDSTMQEINYLEKGIIQAIIIENPFSMGYLGVKFAVDAMQGKKIPSRYLIDTKVIDKNNMYLPENQRMLFPFVW